MGVRKVICSNKGTITEIIIIITIITTETTASSKLELDIKNKINLMTDSLDKQMCGISNINSKELLNCQIMATLNNHTVDSLIKTTTATTSVIDFSNFKARSVEISRHNKILTIILFTRQVWSVILGSNSSQYKA
jgi:hypothetical protein